MFNRGSLSFRHIHVSYRTENVILDAAGNWNNVDWCWDWVMLNVMLVGVL